MSPFDYLSVLISIVLGVGVSELIANTARLAQARERVKFYGPPMFWTANLLIIFVQSWWAIFALHDHKEWNFLQFCAVLVHPLLLSFAAMLLLPKIEGDGRDVIDLKANYERQAPIFFGTLMLLIVLSALRPWAIDGRIAIDANLGFHAFNLALATGGLVVKRPLYHQLAAPLVTVLMGVYIATLFAQIR